MHKNQKGFAHIFAVLIILVLAAAGGIGWYVWHNQPESKNTKASGTQSNSSPATSSDTYTGWNTFSAPREGFTIKYPPTWSVVKGYNEESYDLKATSGLIVRYVYLETLDEEDGGCGQQSQCPTQKILSIDTLKPTNHTDIQLIKTAPDESVECYGIYLNEADAVHKPKVGENKYSDSFFFYSLKDSKKGRYSVHVTNTAAGVTTFDCKNFSQNTYFNNQSVIEAEKILRSISF